MVTKTKAKAPRARKARAPKAKKAAAPAPVAAPTPPAKKAAVVAKEEVTLSDAFVHRVLQVEVGFGFWFFGNHVLKHRN